MLLLQTLMHVLLLLLQHWCTFRRWQMVLHASTQTLTTKGSPHCMQQQWRANHVSF
jgi:hypothetical protein